jgi:hypothetical protein
LSLLDDSLFGVIVGDKRGFLFFMKGVGIEAGLGDGKYELLNGEALLENAILRHFSNNYNTYNFIQAGRIPEASIKYISAMRPFYQ